MAGDPIPCYYDATCITPTSTVNSTSSSFYELRIGSYSQEIRREVRKPKRTKEMMIKERADKLHKQSFVVLNEIKPKVFQVVGYPFKNQPKVHHRNYVLR